MNSPTSCSCQSCLETMHPQEVNLHNVVTDDSCDNISMDVPLVKCRKMYAAAIAALMWAVTMGVAVGYAAPATYSMSKSLHPPSCSAISWISSILALGAMFGGLVGGPLADRCGRKSLLILNVVPYMTGWLMITYSVNVYTIIIGRFITGIACGIVSVTVPMYCVEISTSEVRGLLGSSFQGFMVIGNLLSAIIGSFLSWQNLALAGAGTAAFALACFVWMPESPRWLIAKRDIIEAQSAMNELQGNLLNAREECGKIYSEIEMEPKEMLKFREWLYPSFYKPAIISALLMFFQQFCGSNSVVFFSSSIFDSSHSFLKPKTSTIILGVIQVIATLFSNFIVDRVGRKVLLLLSGGIMGISLVTLGIYYYESSKDSGIEESLSWMPLVCLCIFIIAFSIGYGPLPWLLAAEMVSLRARSTVVGLSTFCNGLFAFITTKTFMQLINIVSKPGVFWIYGFISFVSCIFVALVLPETKGKDFAQITKYFIKKEKDLDNAPLFIISS